MPSASSCRCSSENSLSSSVIPSRRDAMIWSYSWCPAGVAVTWTHRASLSLLERSASPPSTRRCTARVVAVARARSRPIPAGGSSGSPNPAECGAAEPRQRQFVASASVDAMTATVLAVVLPGCQRSGHRDRPHGSCTYSNGEASSKRGGIGAGKEALGLLAGIWVRCESAQVDDRVPQHDGLRRARSARVASLTLVWPRCARRPPRAVRRRSRRANAIRSGSTPKSLREVRIQRTAPKPGCQRQMPNSARIWASCVGTCSRNRATDGLAALPSMKAEYSPSRMTMPFHAENAR